MATHPEDEPRSWRVLGVGIGLAVAVVVYLLRPGLPTVPNLARLSADEAALQLRNIGFQPLPHFSASDAVEDGLVIPETQRPIAGQRSRAGATVSYAVSTGPNAPASPNAPTQTKSSGSFEWTAPKPGEPLELAALPGGGYRATVSGTVSREIATSYRLLLWVRPVRPASESPGWYLQRPPGNGIGSISADGTWDGILQVGSREFPPHEGDIVDLAVSIINSTEARALEGSSGAVIAAAPRGSAVAQLRNVRITIR